MAVHYKFKSNLDHDTVTFDGLSISVADLKKAIMQQKKIGKSSDFDLQITNAQTKEVYDNDEMLVPKNASVIVARVPVATGNKKNWDKPDLPLPIDDDDLGQIRYDRIVKNADLVNANTTEEDKVKAMITQSSQEYDPSKYVKSRSMTGPLPPTYTCFRCGKQGHWIKNCPTNNPDVKRSTGIPRSFMVPVDGPEHKGALLTSSGDYAVPLIDHKAYKEVKKEKPPFVPQDETPPEPEAQIPEELLCMVCKDLLQYAVLIPCCGNSFCDECVRQVLLESDNHECPVCHETEVSPNTLIPNRFLRTAVLNFKNETGYTRIKRAAVVKSPPPPSQRVESPQPSPDSTVEPHATENQPLPVDTTCIKVESPQSVEEKNEVDASEACASKPVEEKAAEDVHSTPAQSPKIKIEDDIDDLQPGTPLADEPPVDIVLQPLPIQAIGQDQYSSDRYNSDYQSGSKLGRNRHEDSHHYKDDGSLAQSKPISTIETITNTRKRFVGRIGLVRQMYPNQRGHCDEQGENYPHERDDYHNRYERRHHVERGHHAERGSQRNSHSSRYDRPRNTRYHPDHEYSHNEHAHPDPHYDGHLLVEEPPHRRPDRYRTPPLQPHPVHIAQPVPPPVYAAPPIPQPLLPTPQVFAPQPPPPGASPIDTSHIAAQPPPPGVGPLLPPSHSGDATASSFPSLSYESEDPLKEVKKVDDRSIDDRIEAFQRELEKRDREYSRDHGSRSRSRSTPHERSRSSSRSRSYSSKSWSRSPSRSSTRTPRSRSRTAFSSRSRSRSYSHSRSRSWSKPRSYTRSRSRTRTESSRSRSRSRAESRLRRRNDSRDRLRSPRVRTRSRSFSPKDYRAAPQRGMPFGNKHGFTPPQYGGSYQLQYGPPPVVPMPAAMRPPTFPPHHMHSIYPASQPIHSRPVEHYNVVRGPKYPPPFSEPHQTFDLYHPKYPPRFDREQRLQRFDKRQEYDRQQEEIPHRIPGWVGDRSRQFKPRYSRDQRKEIKELPKVSETDLRIVHIKEVTEEPQVKKKEEKVIVKHKKHHHHHKSKETKKQDNKIPVVVGAEKAEEPLRNLIKVEVVEKVSENKAISEASVKTTKSAEKVKEKKHKHKKHKAGNEQLAKKKKSTKKEKSDGITSTDSDLSTKVKVKKKKTKLKTIPEDQEKESLENQVVDNSVEPFEEPKQEIESKAVVNEGGVDDQVAKNDSHEPSADTLDLFPEELENEAAILDADIAPEADSTENIENISFENTSGGEVENIEESVISEEEIEEETIEDENVLHVDVPALSKWEREEIEDDFVSRPQRRSAIVVPKDDKGSISSDILHRAELALLSKPFKPRLETQDKNDSKESSAVSSPEVPPSKQKDIPELKSVINSERMPSPTLQVTISTTKDKRSVHSKKDDKNSKNSQRYQSRYSKLDRAGASSRIHEEPGTHRFVKLHVNKGEDRDREYRERSIERRERRQSPPREISSTRRTSRERKDYGRRPERERLNDESFHLREERKYRFVDQDRFSRNDNDYSSSRDLGRHDRRRPLSDYDSQSKHKRPFERDVPRPSDRVHKVENYRRSRSFDSPESYSSLKRKQNEKQLIEQPDNRRSERKRERVQTSHSESSQRRKHSPIKPPDKHESSSSHSKPPKRDFHDDLKFEPDYDEYSDVEEKAADSKERHKRKSISPSVERKRSKVEKLSSSIPESSVKEKSVTSSASSSAISDSDSSDSDDPKGSKSKSSDTDYKQKHKKSKHKKHKKHKRKHKKKKSHKSKQKE